MSSEKHELEISVKSQGAEALKSFADQLDRMGTATGSSDKQLSRMDQKMGKLATTARETAKAMGAQAAATATAAAQQPKMPVMPRYQFRNELGQFATQANASARSLDGFNAALTTHRGNLTAYYKAADNSSSFLGRFQQGISQMDGHLPRIRYALHDVSRQLTLVSAAATAAAVAPIAMAVQWERSFADVKRTVDDLSGAEAKDLFNDLSKMTQEIPQSFRNLTEIASFGGQLGIAKEDITDFTRVVAMMETTTDLSLEAAGTALGRFKALLNMPSGDFEALASSILQVGVNSVATEAQVVNTAIPIISMGQFAGLAAHEVVGLAGALASVGAAPELSRGTITRLFTQMSRAVAMGGERLEGFARIAGMSGASFRRSFGTDTFGDTLQQFLSGINDEGPGAVAVLHSLGITSVRDVPLLMRLSMATETVADSFRNAREGYQSASILQEHYGVIVETTAEKLNLLGNNVQRLLATIGSGATGPLSTAVDMLSGFVGMLTDMLNNPWGQGFALLVMGILGVVGALAGLGATITYAGAGMAGMRTVFLDVIGPLRAGITGMTGYGAAAAGASVGVDKTTASMTRLRAVMNTMIPLLAAAAMFMISEGIESGVGDWVDDSLEDVERWGSGATGAINRVAGTAKEGLGSFQMGLMTPEAMDLTRFGRDILKALPGGSGLALEATRWANPLYEAIEKVDDEIAALASSGNIEEAHAKIKEFETALDIEAGTGLDWLVDTADALKEVATNAGQTTEQMEELANIEMLLSQRSEDIAGMFQFSAEELGALNEHLVKAATGFTNYGGILGELQTEHKEWATAVAESTESAEDSWESYYDGVTVGLDEFTARLQEKLAQQAAFLTNLQALVARGAPELAKAFAEVGGEAGAALAAEAVTRTDEELGEMNTIYAQAAPEAVNAFLEGLQASDAIFNAIGNKTGDAALQAITEGMRAGLTAQDWIALAQEFQFEIPVEADVTYADITLFNKQREIEGLEPIPMPIGADTAPADTVVTGWTPPSKTVQMFANMLGATQDVFNWNPPTRAIPVRISMISSDPTGWEGGATGGLMKDGHFTMRGYASGGRIRGPGTGTSDSIPAWVSNGEFIMNAAAVRHYGANFFDQLNRRQMPGFAAGGAVSSAPAQAGSVTNVNVVQNNPVTRDPLEQLREDTQNLVSGIWS